MSPTIRSTKGAALALLLLLCCVQLSGGNQSGAAWAAVEPVPRGATGTAVAVRTSRVPKIRGSLVPKSIPSWIEIPDDAIGLRGNLQAERGRIAFSSLRTLDQLIGYFTDTFRARGFVIDIVMAEKGTTQRVRSGIAISDPASGRSLEIVILRDNHIFEVDLRYSDPLLRPSLP